jgi:hypothetical protein
LAFSIKHRPLAISTIIDAEVVKDPIWVRLFRGGYVGRDFGLHLFTGPGLSLCLCYWAAKPSPYQLLPMPSQFTEYSITYHTGARLFWDAAAADAISA